MCPVRLRARDGSPAGATAHEVRGMLARAEGSEDVAADQFAHLAVGPTRAEFDVMAAFP